MVYYAPHIIGQYNPLYQTTNQGFVHCSSDFQRVPTPPLVQYSQKDHQDGNLFFWVTPLKTNMSPENQWLEDVFPTEMSLFRGHSLVFCLGLTV